MVRLWHKHYFLLRRQELSYYPTQEALLKSPLLRSRQPAPSGQGTYSTPDKSCDKEVSTPRSRGWNKSQTSTPRSLVSRLSESISSPRSWYPTTSMSSTPRSSTHHSDANADGRQGKSIHLAGAFTHQPAICQLSGRWVFTMVDGIGRNHHFACATEELRESWMKHLQRAAKMDVTQMGARQVSFEEDTIEACGTDRESKMHGDKLQQMCSTTPSEELRGRLLRRQIKSEDEKARERARQSPPPTNRPPNPPVQRRPGVEAGVGAQEGTEMTRKQPTVISCQDEPVGEHAGDIFVYAVLMNAAGHSKAPDHADRCGRHVQMLIKCFSRAVQGASPSLTLARCSGRLHVCGVSLPVLQCFIDTVSIRQRDIRSVVRGVYG